MSGKHTLRRNTYGYSYMPHSLAFDKVDRFCVAHEDGSKEVSLSTVDLLLDDSDGFIVGNMKSMGHRRYGGATINGNLNKHGLWEAVAEELESTCVKKVERMNVPRNSYETVYSVPVIGHKIFLPPADDDHLLGAYNELRTEASERTGHEKLNRSTVKKIKRNPNQYMLWEGKYYDTSLVYVYHPEASNTLKAIGDVKVPKQNLAGPPGIVEFVKNVSYQNNLRMRKYEICRVAHTGQASVPTYGYSYGKCGGWTQRVPEDYLEINLTYPRYVTHIGSTGAYPATTIFPTRRIVGKKRIRRFRAYAAGEDYEQDISNVLTSNGNGIKRSKFAQYVNILKEDEFSLAWVTAYEVHYRHTVTNKWTLLCVTSANTDAFSEHVLDLRPYFNATDGLLTQYLRIRPLEHHHKPMMRVSVYGVDPKHNCGINGSIQHRATRAAMVATGDSDIAATALSADDVPTIEYTVVHGISVESRRYIRDAYWTGNYHYRYGDCKNPKHLKDSQNRNYIRDQQREYVRDKDCD